MRGTGVGEIRATRVARSDRIADSHVRASQVSWLNTVLPQPNTVLPPSNTVLPAATDKAAAVEQLLETGMKPGQVAELLGIDAKDCGLYERPAPPETPMRQPRIPAPSP